MRVEAGISSGSALGGVEPTEWNETEQRTIPATMELRYTQPCSMEQLSMEENKKTGSPRQAGRHGELCVVQKVRVRCLLRRFALLLFFFEPLKGAVGVLADKIPHLTVQFFRLREHVFHIFKIHFDHHIVDAFLFVLIPVHRPNSV